MVHITEKENSVLGCFGNLQLIQTFQFSHTYFTKLGII